MAEMKWQDMKTAPRDGTVFLGGTPDGRCATCCIECEPDETKTRKGFFGLLSPKTETKKGGRFIYYAMPHFNAWSMMNMRPNFGWKPTHWMPLPEPPEGV